VIVEQNNKQEHNVWPLNLSALKSPVTREKYQERLERFFKFFRFRGPNIIDINDGTIVKIMGLVFPS
jgi:hypothetical protein